MLDPSPEEGESCMSVSTGTSHPAASAPPVSITIMNNIPAMVYVMEVHPMTGATSFLYVSDYCKELMGVSPEEAVHVPGTTVNLIVEEDVADFTSALIQSIQDLSLFQRQVRIRRPTDGKVVTVQYQGRPRVPSGEGKTGGDDLTICDGVVMEVIPLAESLQQDAAYKLVRAERGLTEWLSHEIRNPLSVSMEALHTLRELGIQHDEEGGNDLTPQHQLLDKPVSVKECFQVVTESLTYVVDLLNNMMDLDRCAKGQISVVGAPCSVQSDILLPTYRMMKRLRPKASVQLRLAPSLRAIDSDASNDTNKETFGMSDADTDKPGKGADTMSTAEFHDAVVHVDRVRLRQVLTNLIANALHYTTQGFVEVDLQVQASVDNAPTLSLLVRDSGCGVSPADIHTLFSRREQLGTSRNGSGIGLCLCQALLRAMGGSIWLNTNYHSGIQGHPGAEFVVEVPINSVPSPGQRPRNIRNVTDTRAVTPSLSLASSILASQPSMVDHSQLGLTPSLPSKEASPPDVGGASPSQRRVSSDFVHPSRSSCSAISSSSISSSAPAETVMDSLRMTTAATIAVASMSTTVSAVGKKSFFRGKYQLLIVDDEKIGRKFLKRRFSRLFPEATVTEVASGEEALIEASMRQYDVITMDHFMAINEMNGDETILDLRSRLGSDALILGISGNKKEVEHLQAGADLFFQKPLPSDTHLIESLQHRLAPPSGWKVLILSQDDDTRTTLTSRLRRVSSPHYTTEEVANKVSAIQTNVVRLEVIAFPHFVRYLRFVSDGR
jgi:signal transduction histidine kinase/DNA-binding NarL/FixJ family response regulator